MPPLHRHQLAHLSASGWQEVLSMPWDAKAADCLQHWAAHGLPLVVTVQPLPRRHPEAPVAFGLAAPLVWQRRRLALSAPPSQIAWFDEFPPLAQALHLLPRKDQPALQALQVALDQLGVRARVYGSAGWQQITGLSYLREGSDLDLWLTVDDDMQADQAVALLQSCRITSRIDGELVFPHGGGVAWREWAVWRQGRCRSVLVKRLDGALLQRADQDLQAAWPLAA